MKENNKFINKNEIFELIVIVSESYIIINGK